MFLPVLVALVIGVVVPCLIIKKTGKYFHAATSGKKEHLLSATIPLTAWALASLVMLLLLLNYLFGPDCMFCYDPPQLRVGVNFLIATTIYAIIGWGLVQASDQERS